MTSSAGRGTVAGTPRPRNRKAQILEVASGLFCRHGYHNVGTQDIADAVGITAGALYRHFRSKQDLLAQTIISSFEQATEELGQRRAAGVHGVAEGVVQAAIARRDLGVLWNRETRHLDDEHRRAMRAQFFALVRLFTAELCAARGDLTMEDAELLVWALLGVLTSHAHHDTPAGPDLLAEVLRAMAIEVVSAPLASEPVAEPSPSPPGPGLLPHSSRERLLVVSIRLFARHGYQAVSMADVGAAAGVTGTAVYRHFATKSELLAAGLARSVDPLRLGVADALESASTPAEALENVVGAHVDFALRQHDLLGLLVSETVNLQGPQRREIHAAQQEYVQEWVHLVRQSGGRRSVARARFLVYGALTMISDVTRTASLRSRPDLAVQLRLLALRVLSA